MARTMGGIGIVLGACLLPGTAGAAFTDVDAGLPGVLHGSAAWGDYDADGDLDLALVGETLSGRIARIYRNSSLEFVASNLPVQAAVSRSAIAWGDYDRDGDLDLVVAGTDGTTPVTVLLRNDGGEFVDSGHSFDGVEDGGVAWGDYDNDGDLDLVITGTSGSAQLSRLYRNTGSGFTAFAAGLVRLGASSVAWGDYDGDGDLDLVLSGLDGTIPTTVIYRNNDGASFSPIAALLPGVSEGSLAWGDYDNDGDLDLLMTGRTGTFTGLSRVYRNTGGSFTDIGAGLQGCFGGTAIWGDFDNDGDLDIAVAGNAFSSSITSLYRNNGGVFSLITTGIVNVKFATLAWGDFDGDSDLDLALAGENALTPTARIYRNSEAMAPNAPPGPPTGLVLTSDGTRATFSWNAAVDPQGGSTGLSYNLRIGRTPGADDLMPAMARADGLRRVAQIGNVGERRQWSISLAALGGSNVYWSVQAIDQAFAGSPFATDQLTPLAAEPPGLPPAHALLLDGPNPFRGAARIRCSLPGASRVEVAVHDVAGRRVRLLLDRMLPAGSHRVTWNGGDDRGLDCAAGVYFVHLEGEGVSESLRILKLR